MEREKERMTITIMQLTEHFDSDALHTTYRALKSQVQAAETVEEVKAITWDD